jgi:hypothetical protein
LLTCGNVKSACLAVVGGLSRYAKGHESGIIVLGGSAQAPRGNDLGEAGHRHWGRRGTVGHGAAPPSPRGKLRDHRADIKHSLVDPVQLHVLANVRACAGRSRSLMITQCALTLPTVQPLFERRVSSRAESPVASMTVIFHSSRNAETSVHAGPQVMTSINRRAPASRPSDSLTALGASACSRVLASRLSVKNSISVAQK